MGCRVPEVRMRRSKKVSSATSKATPRGGRAPVQHPHQWVQRSSSRSESSSRAGRQLSIRPPSIGSPTLTMGAAWKVMGARGRQAGVDDSVADLSTTEPRPAMASTLPDGTLCTGFRGQGSGFGADLSPGPRWQASCPMPCSSGTLCAEGPELIQLMVQLTWGGQAAPGSGFMASARPMSQGPPPPKPGSVAAPHTPAPPHLQPLQGPAHHHVQRPQHRRLPVLGVGALGVVRRRQYVYRLPRARGTAVHPAERQEDLFVR